MAKSSASAVDEILKPKKEEAASGAVINKAPDNPASAISDRQIELLRAELDELKVTVRTQQAVINSFMAKQFTSAEMQDYSGRILARLEQQKRSGGKFRWFVKMKEYGTFHEFFAASDNEPEARREYERRVGYGFDRSKYGNKQPLEFSLEAP